MKKEMMIILNKLNSINEIKHNNYNKMIQNVLERIDNLEIKK